MNASLECARKLLAIGFSVIPVPRPRAGASPGQPGDGKVPTIPWREYQRRLPSQKEVTRWFRDCHEPCNIAIVTGWISDLVVVDADSTDAVRELTRRLPPTPWQVRTSKGFHAYYRHPGVHVANRARLDTGAGRIALDVRGDGGYVIAAGSIHASGVEYLEAGDWSQPRERVPKFWPGWLERPKRATATPRTSIRPSRDVVERARRYLAAIPRPEIGQGSDAQTLYAACRLVRGFGLSESDAVALLWDWAGGRPGWTYEWVARKVRHAQRYGSEPVGALR